MLILTATCFFSLLLLLLVSFFAILPTSITLMVVSPVNSKNVFLVVFIFLRAYFSIKNGFSAAL